VLTYVQLFFLGLPIAGLFALLATGVVMVYRASRILNLAVGGMAMFTAYALFQTHKWGVPLPLALILALGFAAWLGWATERFLLRPLRSRPVLVSVIMTVAVLALMTALATLIWGSDRQNAPQLLPDEALTFAQITLGVDRIMILAITGLLMLGVIYLFKRTTIGVAMRAVSDDRNAALLMGIPADRVSSLTWIIGATLAGAAGILVSPVIGLQPVNLTLLAIPAYAAAVFGGLRSLPLTMVGALIIGVMYSIIPSLPLLGSQGSDPFPGTRELSIFLAVVVFLLVRGQSLLGSVQEEEI
jgi:branched-subunit amino acid ABC-type transport system permease component